MEYRGLAGLNAPSDSVAVAPELRITLLPSALVMRYSALPSVAASTPSAGSKVQTISGVTALVMASPEMATSVAPRVPASVASPFSA